MKDTILIDQKTGKKYKLMEIQETEKYAFIIGHTEKDKGAFSEHLKVQEWDIFKNFSNAFLTDSGDIFTHNKDISSYTCRGYCRRFQISDLVGWPRYSQRWLCRSRFCYSRHCRGYCKQSQNSD